MNCPSNCDVHKHPKCKAVHRSVNISWKARFVIAFLHFYAWVPEGVHRALFYPVWLLHKQVEVKTVQKIAERLKIAGFADLSPKIVMQNLWQNIYLMLLARLRPKSLRVEWESSVPLKELQNQGPTVWWSLHTGPWEAFHLLGRTLWGPACVLVRPEKGLRKELLAWFRHESPQLRLADSLPKAFLKGASTKNESIMYLADQFAGSAGIDDFWVENLHMPLATGIAQRLGKKRQLVFFYAQGFCNKTIRFHLIPAKTIPKTPIQWEAYWKGTLASAFCQLAPQWIWFYK
jgi:hypothetical protein